MPVTSAEIQRALTEAKAIRASRTDQKRRATDPVIPLEHGWRLDLVRGVVLSASGIDLGAVEPPGTVEQVKAVVAEVAALVPTHREASKRAAIRGLSMYRVRSRGPQSDMDDKAMSRTITLTRAQWDAAERLGNGNASAGVRLAIESAGNKKT